MRSHACSAPQAIIRCPIGYSRMHRRSAAPARSTISCRIGVRPSVHSTSGALISQFGFGTAALWSACDRLRLFECAQANAMLLLVVPQHCGLLLSASTAVDWVLGQACPGWAVLA